LSLQHVRAGKRRALAITSKTRWSELPDVPTLAEAGLPGEEADAMVDGEIKPSIGM
jgi:tripartite-type tricarboxylate transporter receptor subunit TctC